MFMNINGAVVADTSYVNNTLVAKDVSISLPEVVPQTVDVAAMGTLSLPIWQMIDNMETSITKIGIDMGLRALITPEPLDIEHRWVHTRTDANGKTTNVGCKAFIHAIPNKIPAVGVTLGEAGENECTAVVTRYQLFADGEEMWCIDRLAGIIRIGGVDYAGGINNLL